MRTTAQLGTLFLVLAGCGSTTLEPDVCESDCELTLILGTMDERGEHAPHVSGTPFPWSWGFQGGTMIQPLFALDPTEVREGDDIDLTLRHDPDPDFPDQLGQAAEFPVMTTQLPVWRTEAGELVIGPVLDQIGWSELDGVRLTLTAEARTAGGREGIVVERLELAPSAPVDPACEPFPIEDGGCAYRVFDGVATVTAIVDPDPGTYTCAGGQQVELSFVMNDTENAEACIAGMGASIPETQRLLLGAGANPPAECLDAAGITVGSSFPARYMAIVRGGCSPQVFWTEADLGDCVCST